MKRGLIGYIMALSEQYNEFYSAGVNYKDGSPIYSPKKTQKIKAKQRRKRDKKRSKK